MVALWDRICDGRDLRSKVESILLKIYVIKICIPLRDVPVTLKIDTGNGSVNIKMSPWKSAIALQKSLALAHNTLEEPGTDLLIVRGLNMAELIKLISITTVAIPVIGNIDRYRDSLPQL